MFFEVLLKTIKNKVSRILYQSWKVEFPAGIRYYKNKNFSTKIFKVEGEDKEGNGSHLLSPLSGDKNIETNYLYFISEAECYYKNINHYNMNEIKKRVHTGKPINIINSKEIKNIPVISGKDEVHIIKEIVLYKRRKYIQVFLALILLALLMKSSLNLYYYRKVKEQKYLMQYYMEYISLNKSLPAHKDYALNKFLRKGWLGNRDLFNITNEMQEIYNKHIYDNLILSGKFGNKDTLCFEDVEGYESLEVNRACKYLQEKGFLYGEIVVDRKRNIALDKMFTIFKGNINVIFDRDKIVKKIVEAGVDNTNAVWVYSKYISNNVEELLSSSGNIYSEEFFNKKNDYINYTDKIKEILSTNHFEQKVKEKLLSYLKFRMMFQDKLWNEINFESNDIEDLAKNMHQLEILHNNTLNKNLQEFNVIEHLQEEMQHKLNNSIKIYFVHNSDFARAKNKAEYYPLNQHAANEMALSDMSDVLNVLYDFTDKLRFNIETIKNINRFEWIDKSFKIKRSSTEIKKITSFNGLNGNCFIVELIPSSKIHRLVFNVLQKQYTYLNQRDFKVEIPMFSRVSDGKIVITKCARDKLCDSKYYSGAWAGLKLMNSLSVNKSGYYCLEEDKDICAHVSGVRKKTVEALFYELGALLREN